MGTPNSGRLVESSIGPTCSVATTLTMSTATPRTYESQTIKLKYSGTTTLASTNLVHVETSGYSKSTKTKSHRANGAQFTTNNMVSRNQERANDISPNGMLLKLSPAGFAVVVLLVIIASTILWKRKKSKSNL